MVIVHIIDKFSSDRLFLYLVLDIYSFNPIKPGLFGASQTWGGADSAPLPLEKSVLYLWWEYETYLDYKVL